MKIRSLISTYVMFAALVFGTQAYSANIIHTGRITLEKQTHHVLHLAKGQRYIPPDEIYRSC